MSPAGPGASKSAFRAIGLPISAATATARSRSRQGYDATIGIPCVASRVSASPSEIHPPAGFRSRNASTIARAAGPSRSG